MPRTRQPRGISERIETSAGNKYTLQVLKSGQRVYRKNGKFTSARAFHAAKGSKRAKRTPGFIARTPGQEDFRPRSIDLVRKDGTAGVEAYRVLPYLKAGDPLTKKERDILYEEFRMQRTFIGVRDKLTDFGAIEMSHEEIQARFQAFMDAMKEARTAFERNQIRIEFFGPGTNLEKVLDDLDEAA